MKNGIRASREQLGPGSEPVKPNGRPQYHPFEDVAEATLDNVGAARLTSAESARTIVEVVHCIQVVASISTISTSSSALCCLFLSRFGIVNMQVNSKATLMFSSVINDEVHENIMCPDLPYVTDEHGSKSSV